MTFFSVFDVPVFWPILLMYWCMLFFMTMKQQIKHMIKHKYLPFSMGEEAVREEQFRGGDGRRESAREKFPNDDAHAQIVRRDELVTRVTIRDFAFTARAASRTKIFDLMTVFQHHARHV